MDKTTSSLNALFIREGRLHPAWRAGLYTLSYFFLLFAVQVPLVLAWLTITLIKGQALEAAVAGLEVELTSLTWFLPLALLQATLVVGLTYIFRRLIDRKSFVSLGFATTSGWVAEILLGLFLGFAVMACIFSFGWVTGWSTVHFTPSSMYRVILQLAGYVIVFLATGLTEELMFRGYLLQTLREWPGTAAAVVITSVLFGLFHACNPSVSPLALVNLIVAGFVFAYAYLATGRLWLPIALHFSWNFFQGPVFGLPVSGVLPQGLFVVELTGPEWVTGGAFGPEAGLTGLLALGIIAVVIWAWSQVTGKRTAGETG
jgi:membrane protease YdiL (CAAX protease family)